MEPNDQTPDEQPEGLAISPPAGSGVPEVSRSAALAPLPPDLAGPPAVASPAASRPPLPPDLAGPTAAGGTGSGSTAPGLDAATWVPGSGMPPGGQPPYSPPYGWAWPPGGQQDGGPTAASRRRRKLVAALGGIALVAGGLGAGLGAAFGSGSSAPAGSATLAPLPKSSETSLSPKSTVGQIAAAVEPSVVDINVSEASPAGQTQAQASGTGMIVTPTGEVLTNNHVVEDATTISVVLPHRGTYAARVLGVDPSKDVALVQIEHAPANLPYVTLGDSSSLAIGQSVIAIGNAYGLGGQPSIATGVVSALNRTITASDSSPTASVETLHGMIQTDAPIAAGDSGGPLVDGKGQVVGMDTAAVSGDGGTLGFAIPINTARTIVRQIEQGQGSATVLLGTSPFLGIYEVQGQGSPYSGFGGFGGLPGFGSSQPSAPVSGVQIYDVIQNSPAQRAGLQAGDTITAIGGQKTPTWSALSQAIGGKKPGDSITVDYVDGNGASHSVSVVLAGLPK